MKVKLRTPPLLDMALLEFTSIADLHSEYVRHSIRQCAP